MFSDRSDSPLRSSPRQGDSDNIAECHATRDRQEGDRAELVSDVEASRDQHFLSHSEKEDER